MGKYTILMNNKNKRLIATSKINLRQHESLVDKFEFVIPYAYSDEIDLREFQVALYWIDPVGVVHMDILEKEAEIYKEEYQRYFLPVTSPLNKYAGEIEMKLVFTMVDYETETRYKLETDSIIVEIKTIKDYYSVIPNESFSYVEDKVDELKAIADQMNADAEVYFNTKADNHRINDDGQLVLMANGKILENTGVDVATVEVPDDDDTIDGVIDISGKYDEVLL